MRWTLSEFLNLLEIRGQTWCIAELGGAAGFSIPHSEAIYFYAALDGHARIAGVTSEAICLQPGDVALVLSGEAHALRTAPQGRAEILEFLRDGSHTDIPPTLAIGDGGPVAARLLCGRLKVRWPGGLLPSAIPAAVTLDAGDTLVSTSDLSQSAIGAGAAGLLTRIASLMLAAALRRHGQGWELFTASANSDPIARAMQFIDRHAARPWTVATLADKVGMGRSNFAARFVAVTGHTPMEMLAERRMQHAVDLLHHDALKISEVALRVGYRSEAAFIRRFVEQFGITPGRMRATFQADEEPLQVAS
jgi:AraC-like DNA-binding protein